MFEFCCNGSTETNTVLRQGAKGIHIPCICISYLTLLLSCIPTVVDKSTLSTSLKTEMAEQEAQGFSKF